jgi:hypothetical protein
MHGGAFYTTEKVNDFYNAPKFLNLSMIIYNIKFTGNIANYKPLASNEGSGGALAVDLENIYLDI